MGLKVFSNLNHSDSLAMLGAGSAGGNAGSMAGTGLHSGQLLARWVWVQSVLRSSGCHRAGCAVPAGAVV